MSTAILSYGDDTEQSALLAEVSVDRSADRWIVSGSGHWTMDAIQDIDSELRDLEKESFPGLVVDTSQVSSFDTGGAWLVERLRRCAERSGRAFEHRDPDIRRIELVEVVEADDTQQRGGWQMPRFSIGFVEKIGRGVVAASDDFITTCHLIGASIRGPQMKTGKRGGIRLISIIHQLDQMGLRAVPVITVMSFLIGAILAQQGAFQLRAFGEELLTVNLVGLLLLREIGVLLTAVMVAGRTGSAITAEIGTMKMREEIDALEVIGLNPVGVLIFPRLVALIIALPILTLLADLAGILGAIVVGMLYIGITPQEFLSTLQSGISIQHLFAGLIKAPFMAVIIGLVASVEGLKVGGSAESLGRHTTSSVVRSIFVVILVDGLFAIFYTSIGV